MKHVIQCGNINKDDLYDWVILDNKDFKCH